MSGVEPPWEELHHRSYFLPKLDHLECEDIREILIEKIGSPIISLIFPSLMANGNMVNISPTIPIKSLTILARLRMSIFGQNVPMLRFKSIPSYSKSFVIYLLGHMRKCQVSTLALLNMKLKLIPMLSLFDNVCVR